MADNEIPRLQDDLDSFKADTTYRLNALERQNAVTAVLLQNIQQSITNIDDNTKWLIRIVSGAFVVSIIGFILQGGFGLDAIQ
jgi:hypothetical protein